VSKAEKYLSMQPYCRQTVGIRTGQRKDRETDNAVCTDHLSEKPQSVSDLCLTLSADVRFVKGRHDIQFVFTSWT